MLRSFCAIIKSKFLEVENNIKNLNCICYLHTYFKMNDFNFIKSHAKKGVACSAWTLRVAKGLTWGVR